MSLGKDDTRRWAQTKGRPMSELAPSPVTLAGEPIRPPLPPEYNHSYAQVGIIAQRGKLIEVRTPTVSGKGDWPRIYLDAEAAEKLMVWLPQALAFAKGEEA